MDNEGVFTYTVLMGVSPDMSTDEVTFEHIESVNQTEMLSASSEHFSANGSYYHQSSTPPLLAHPLPHHPNQHQHGYHNCSHSTVTRQSRIDQYETCNSCGSRPFFRWFYTCTEDTTDYTAAKDRESLLSEWITDAILAGEYSEEQRDILMKQKLKVLEMCEMEAAASKTGARLRTTQTAQTTQTTEQSSYHYEAHQTNFSSETRPSPSIPNVQSRPSRCQYKACHHCDRKLQERTWVSLNAVCDDPNIKPPNAWDLWKTPVSDVEHVRNLGLRPARPPPPPPHYSQYSQYVYRASHRREIRRATGQYFAAYESSVTVGLESNLTTIEEMTEEMESLSIGQFNQRHRRVSAEAVFPGSENQRPGSTVSRD